RFLGQWGAQAEALGWTARDLFGLAAIPAKPHQSYRRLSRYDETGLIWLLCGRQVLALTESTAVGESQTRTATVYRRHNKPALGPLWRLVGGPLVISDGISITVDKQSSG